MRNASQGYPADSFGQQRQFSDQGEKALEYRLKVLVRREFKLLSRGKTTWLIAN
jgi:hypothetical protein